MRRTAPVLLLVCWAAAARAATSPCASDGSGSLSPKGKCCGALSKFSSFATAIAGLTCPAAIESFTTGVACLAVPGLKCTKTIDFLSCPKEFCKSIADATHSVEFQPCHAGFTLTQGTSSFTAKQLPICGPESCSSSDLKKMVAYWQKSVWIEPDGSLSIECSNDWHFWLKLIVGLLLVAGAVAFVIRKRKSSTAHFRTDDVAYAEARG